MWITYSVGRDALTGHFVPIKVALKRRRTAIIETIRYWRKPRKP